MEIFHGMSTKSTSAVLLSGLCLALIPTRAFASQLLVDYNLVGFIGTTDSICPNPTRVSLFLEHDSEDFTQVLQLGVGQQYWAAGDSGTYDFTPTNTQYFKDFASLLTDGQDELLLEYLYVEDCGGGNIGGDAESSRLRGAPDLIGSNLEFIRLVVNNISREPYTPPCDCGPGTRFDANINWQFWGTPVPEPTTLTLLFIIALLRRHRRVPFGRVLCTRLSA